MGFWGSVGGFVNEIGQAGKGIFGSMGSQDKDLSQAKYDPDDRSYLGNLSRIGIDDTFYRQGNVPQAERTQLGQAAQLDAGQQAQFRNQQMAQANRLGAIASGQQQGAGELAAQRQANRSIAQQQAMARMGRGQAGAGRMAARNVADIGTSAAGQSQVAALQDQQAANAQLGSVLAQGREGDIGMAGQNAQLWQQHNLQQGGLDQQRNLANIDMQLRARGMDDQTRLAYMQQLSQMNANEMNARVAMSGGPSQPGQGAQVMQQMGPIIAAAAMSDKRAKKNIRDGGADIDEMLNHLKAVSYEYKSGAPKEYVGDLGDGRRIAGFIAQDLSKSKAGKAIVSETADGRQVVDVRGGLFAAIAASARLNERVRELEKKKD